MWPAGRGLGMTGVSYTIGCFQITMSTNKNTHKIGANLPSPRITSKRNLSNSSLSPNQNCKKSKFFVSPNKFAVLANNCENSDVFTPSICSKGDSTISPHAVQDNDPPAPPIYIKNIANYSAFNSTLTSITGPNAFTCKSSASHLIVQPSGQNSFNKIISHLNETDASFHSFSPRFRRPYRVVIRNLHPSTLDTDISSFLDELGYQIKHIYNAKDKNKRPLPLFFVEIYSDEKNEDIHNIKSLLNTKVDILSNTKDINQIQNAVSSHVGTSKSDQTTNTLLKNDNLIRDPRQKGTNALLLFSSGFGPYQPNNIIFPQHLGRKFRPKWYPSFLWIEYSPSISNKKQNIKIMKYNLNKIPIEGNILIIDHGHISGNGKPYASKILESPTWLEICKIANDLIITTGTYFFKYLNDICVVQDLENIKICCLGMGVLSYVNKKIEIESPCYYNLDEKLKKYLGFQNRTFDFSLDINTSTMYVPNSNEQYINIEKQCDFRLGRNGQIPLGTIFIGIYSINEIENVFNSFGAIYVANFPKIKFEIINGFLNVTASIGLCFDEYLSNCLGFDYIGNFKKLIPINKTWPRGKEIVLGVEYTEPDIAYTVIGIKKPNLYTNVFLKNFNGVIRSNKVKTLIKGNYSIDQLNSKLPPGIKLQNDKNCITLTSKTDFYMDQNFKLSLGIENMYFLYKHNGDILNNKSLLDVHCNIIEKSFSSINDKCHIEEDLLYNFYYNDDNPYIKTNPIKYIPVNGGFQEIKIDIINQDGKKYDFDDDNFIVYLDLIKE
ncbi:hypothetical protein QTP88_028948 [Uroleucon formosanum]